MISSLYVPDRLRSEFKMKAILSSFSNLTSEHDSQETKTDAIFRVGRFHPKRADYANFAWMDDVSAHAGPARGIASAVSSVPVPDVIMPG
jgi:hypothetical protein